MKSFTTGWPLSLLHNPRTWFCLPGEKVILTSSNFPLAIQLVFLFITEFAVCDKSSLWTILTF